MKDLLKLYDEFFKTLSKRVEESNTQIIEAASPDEVDNLASEFNIFIPDDIRSYLCEPKTVYKIKRFTDTEEWEAGFDFLQIDIIRRNISMYRDDLAPIYEDEDDNFLYNLHLNCVPLSFAEPALVYDADPLIKKPGLYLMLWDGEASFEPIAPDFTTFFTHWLASGCFRGREFKKYWEVVKDIVPIKIPLNENLWLNYYSRLYKNQYTIF